MKALSENAKKCALEEEAAKESEDAKEPVGEEKAEEGDQETDASVPSAEVPSEDDGELVEGPSDVESGMHTSNLIPFLSLTHTQVSSCSSSTSSSSGYAHPLLSSFGTTSFCDGPCSTQGLDYKELHSCRICPYVAMCETCLPLFRSGGFPNRICNVKHGFFQVFPLPEGSEDIAVRVVDGRVEGREEWLGGLREAYSGRRKEGGRG